MNKWKKGAEGDGKKCADVRTSLIFKWTEVRLAVHATLSDEKFRSLTVLFSSVGIDIFYISIQYRLNWFFSVSVSGRSERENV